MSFSVPRPRIGNIGAVRVIRCRCSVCDGDCDEGVDGVGVQLYDVLSVSDVCERVGEVAFGDGGR